MLSFYVFYHIAHLVHQNFGETRHSTVLTQIRRKYIQVIL
jgi:hypothetical protein